MTKYLCLLLVAVLTGCGEQKQRLNIFGWPEDLDPKLISEFEEQFHCKVAIDLYTTSEMMMAKLTAGGDSVYDIVCPASGNLASLIKRGLLAPLRHESIPDLNNIDPAHAEPSVDPQMQFSVPYQWGTGGLYVRKLAGTIINETWGLIFDPAQQIGPFLLSEDPGFTIGAALLYQQFSLWLNC